MVIYYNLMKEERERLEKEISLLEKQIKKLPAKDFVLIQNGKYQKWYESQQGELKIIKKKEREFAQKLAQRRVLCERLKRVSEEEKAIKLYLEKSPGRIDVDDYFSEKGYGKLLDNRYSQEALAVAWANEEYPRKTDYLTGLTKRTSFGLLVRSKSEAAIAEALYRHGIPFRYEWVQKFDGVEYGIDFTSMNPVTGKIFYWEHFGFMDDAGYVTRTIPKIKTFSDNGIFLGVNLIITGETLDHPFMPDDAERAIRHFFPEVMG